MDAASHDWRTHGIRIVRAGELDSNTPQTPGMTRAAAITHATAGASKLWVGTVTVQPAARTGAHHHGELETVLYIIRGRARFRWGDHLEFVEDAGPGDFIYVPPPHPTSGEERAAGPAGRGCRRPQRPGAGCREPRHREPRAGYGRRPDR